MRILFYCFAIFFVVTSCTRKNIDSNNKEIVFSIDSLSIPKCELCDTLGMKRNILFFSEVNVNDRIALNKNVLYIITSQNDTLSRNGYSIRDTTISIHGGDWIDYATIVKRTNKSMVIKKTQKSVHRTDEEATPKYLLIYMSTRK